MDFKEQTQNARRAPVKSGTVRRHKLSEQPRRLIDPGVDVRVKKHSLEQKALRNLVSRAYEPAESSYALAIGTAKAARYMLLNDFRKARDELDNVCPTKIMSGIILLRLKAGLMPTAALK